jgi:hypothetical protein
MRACTIQARGRPTNAAADLVAHRDFSGVPGRRCYSRFTFKRSGRDLHVRSPPASRSGVDLLPLPPRGRDPNRCRIRRRRSPAGPHASIDVRHRLRPGVSHSLYPSRAPRHRRTAPGLPVPEYHGVARRPVSECRGTRMHDRAPVGRVGPPGGMSSILRRPSGSQPSPTPRFGAGGCSSRCSKARVRRRWLDRKRKRAS